MILKDKWALITGSSRGIGKIIAKELANRGCKIILHSRTINGSKTLLEEIKNMSIECHSVAAELNDTNQVEKLIQEVRTITGGHLDILYNNAAIMTPFRDIYKTPPQDYTESFMVNTIAPAMLCDAFIPSMLKNNWGRIVNVTSGIKDQPGLMAYSCSKAALDRYVRDMVESLKSTNVLLNLMDPGWLKTDLGGIHAPNNPESVLPGAIIPILLEKSDGSGKLYCAQDYVNY